MTEHPTMPVIEVSGTPHEIGTQHGLALKSTIATCVDIYRGVFGLDDAEVRRRAEHFESVTRAWHPELATEIDAIADAADQPRHWIWAINSRSEIMSYTGTEATECTSVWSPATLILAQNWDWMRSLEPITVLLVATHSDGHQTATVTEPGIVGKVGMSSAGVGVGLNFLYSPEPLDGVPVHVLLRALLDARSVADAEALIDSAGNGRSGHVFFATAEGYGSSLEYTGKQLWRRDSSDDPLLHTNHFLFGDVPHGTAVENSLARYERSAALVAAAGVDQLDRIRALLDDGGNPDFPICRPWAPSDTLEGVETGTVCAVIMRLADGEIDVRRGYDPAGTWQTHRLTHSTSLTGAAS